MSYLFGFSQYLPADAETRLKAYEYHGEDRSYIYSLVWRPLCRRTVGYLPMWLAPNVITVSALIIVIFVHLGFLYYMPNLTFTQEVPAPLFWAAGITLVMYQYLDNLDGHQARRTHSSSPLGLLMDHGCDAFNTCVGTLTLASATCCGPTWKTWAVLMSGVIVFFCNTWEEYYRGELILPVLNGPNEGILIAVAIYIYTSFQTPLWWLNTFSVRLADYLPELVLRPLAPFLFVHDGSYEPTTTTLTMHYNTVAVHLLLFFGFVTICGNFYQVWKAVKGKQGHGKYGNGWLLKHYPFVHACSRLIPLVIVTVLANTWFYFSPTSIFLHHPRLCCWTVGLIYNKLSIHLMIAHLNSMEFHPLRRTLVPFIYLGIHLLAQTSRNHWVAPPFDEELVLYEFFGLSSITFLHLCVNAATETAMALHISVWTIPHDSSEKKVA